MPDPKVVRARDIIVGRIGKDLANSEELVIGGGIGDKNDRILPTYRFQPGKKGTYRGLINSFDDLQTVFEEEGFITPTPGRAEAESFTDEILDLLADNSLRPEDTIRVSSIKNFNKEIDNKINILESNGFDPKKMTDSEVAKVLDEIAEQDQLTLSQLQAEQSVAKQNTDDIYQAQMQRQKV